MNCNLCNNHNYKKRNGSVRDNKDLEIFECCGCGLVFLSEYKHIDDKFYENSKMHKEFNFQIWRNQTLEDDNRRFEFIRNTITNKKVLDFGSGNGGFLLNAKSVTKEIAGVELDDAVKSFYQKDEIKLYKDLDKITDKYDVITSFHVIEHLKNPIEILEKLKVILNTNGKIIIEVPNANDALLTIYESEAFSHFTYWSCHLYLYTQHTLGLLAKKVGLKVDFIKYIQRYPLSNHLYWLSKNKPGGHNIWGNFLDSSELTRAYESQLASLSSTDTIIACFSKDDE
jgi:2-polyprenyl-3-methyl-5-hydroxy-6-metoxy-1,4-benzoquinol methylase